MIGAIIFTFFAVFLLVTSILMAILTSRESPNAVLKRRLRRMAAQKDKANLPEELRSEILKEIPPFEQILAKIPVLSDLDRHLDHAGLKIRTMSFLSSVLAGSFIAIAVVFVITHNLLFSVIAAAIPMLAAVAVINFKKKKRLDKFTEQMPDVLVMISRSLRAGHSLTSAVELVGSEMANPAGELFKIAYEQQKLGLRITDTLADISNHIESLDLRFFITSVAINSEVGGNLAEILDKLADTIRERLKIRRQVRVYSAQGRLSGYVLAVMPFVAFFMMYILMPNYEKILLTEKIGNLMLISAGVMQLIGFLIIRKIVDIRI